MGRDGGPRIRTCISSLRFSMLVNSNLLGFYLGSRGLREDSFLLLLCLLIMQVLNKMIGRVVVGGRMKGLRWRGEMGRIWLSHTCCLHSIRSSFVELIWRTLDPLDVFYYALCSKVKPEKKENKKMRIFHVW